MPRSVSAAQSTAFQARAATPPASFECSQINGDPDAICVHALGELDIASAPLLESTLREAVSTAGLVVLDLGDLAFIDSAGVHAVVNASIHARRLARRLVILPGPATVERIFALAGAQGTLVFGVGEAPLPDDAGAKRREQEQAEQRIRSITRRRPSAAVGNPAPPLRAVAAATTASQVTGKRAEARLPITADGGERHVPLAPAALLRDGLPCSQ